MEFVSLKGPTYTIRDWCAYTKHGPLTSLNGSGTIPMWRRWGKVRENRSKAPMEME